MMIAATATADAGPSRRRHGVVPPPTGHVALDGDGVPHAVGEVIPEKRRRLGDLNSRGRCHQPLHLLQLPTASLAGRQMRIGRRRARAFGEIDQVHFGEMHG
jgi:hypothetical protein